MLYTEIRNINITNTAISDATITNVYAIPSEFINANENLINTVIPQNEILNFNVIVYRTSYDYDATIVIEYTYLDDDSVLRRDELRIIFHVEKYIDENTKIMLFKYDKNTHSTMPNKFLLVGKGVDFSKVNLFITSINGRRYISAFNKEYKKIMDSDYVIFYINNENALAMNDINIVEIMIVINKNAQINGFYGVL